MMYNVYNCHATSVGSKNALLVSGSVQYHGKPVQCDLGLINKRRNDHIIPTYDNWHVSEHDNVDGENPIAHYWMPSSARLN